MPWKIGNREWGMGNGEWGMGNGEWGIGNGEWKEFLPMTRQDEIIGLS
ncbi:MAG TPA: hypothetical protein V6C85_19145 [Allocoleopsis sp.]